MRHPVECFDSPALGTMARALDAAVATVRLTGVEPDDTVRWEMAQRILAAARLGATSLQALTEAALAGRWTAFDRRTPMKPLSSTTKNQSVTSLEPQARPIIRMNRNPRVRKATLLAPRRAANPARKAN